MYEGRGDHAADEYSWYYGWEVVRQHWERAVPNKDAKILLPGIGNDPLLLDLVSSGWQQCTAFDYTESAIERQRDLLSYNPQATLSVQLQVWDATALPDEMSSTPFDAVLEKGALDAIYLSGEGQVEKAARELWRVTKRGGVCLSFSGVVPQDVRKKCFPECEWKWLRDGADDLQAGCFILERL